MLKWFRIWCRLVFVIGCGCAAPLPLRAAAAASSTPVLINEIHPDPLVKTARAEYVELYNPGATPVDLSSWTLAGGVGYTFPAGTQIPADGYLLVAANPAGVRQLYGVTPLGPYTGGLAKEGETLVLRDGSAQEVDRLTYGFGFPWPLVSGEADTALGLVNWRLDNGQAGAWRSGPPTPGRANAQLLDNAPPFIAEVAHTPLAPRSTDEVEVRAHVADADGVAGVQLLVQVVLPGQYIRLTDAAYGAQWRRLPMTRVGDDLYAARLPAEWRQNRTLVRYRVEAADSAGRQVTVPYADDTQPNFALYVYDGIPPWSGRIRPDKPDPPDILRTYDFSQMRSLPAYTLIANAADVQDAQFIPDSGLPVGYGGDDYPWLGTFVYDGRVYDHIGFRARGGEYRYAVGKNHWKFNFRRGHAFQAYDDYGIPYPTRWDKLNFSSVFQHANRGYRGEQGLFESLSYRLYNLAGVAAPATHFVHFRVVDAAAPLTADQYEGDFWGLYLAIENLDGNFLDSHGLPDGNLYEMKNWSGELDNQGATGVTDRSDLDRFINTYSYGNPSSEWWRRNFDLDGYFSYRAVLEGIRNYDVDQGKNYAYYLNPSTGKWSLLPWDVDLTWAEIFFGQGEEPFRRRVLSQPAFQVAYQNRLRELRDLLLNPEQLYPMINEYAALIDTPATGLSMVDADRARWDYSPILRSPYIVEWRARQGYFYRSVPDHTFRGMVAYMLNFANARMAWIDANLLLDKAYPATPALYYVGPPNYPADQLTFAPGAFVDPQGAQTFARVQWRAAEIVWPGLPGDRPEERNRYEIEATWLSDEQNSLAQVTLPNGVCRPGLTCRVRVRMQDDSGRWSHWSAPAQFAPGAPAANIGQLLRVTEMMVQPQPAGNVPVEELEFIELQNLSDKVIDLSHIRFADGIRYEFPVGASLAPNAYFVLAANQEQFARHYGFAAHGEFDGHLSDDGERLTLEDAFGVQAWTFAYGDGGWPGGNGHSLALLTGVPLAELGRPASWRASVGRDGSPGFDDPAPILINELQLDAENRQLVAVELYNPTAVTADVSGWLLSTQRATLPGDLFAAPSGYRLPNGTRVPPGGYRVLALAAATPRLLTQGDAGLIALFSSGPANRLSGYVHGLPFDVPPLGATLGRVTNSDGETFFAPQRAATLGRLNGEPRVGPVVISQIMVTPPDGVEWLELTNLTDEPVPLYNPDRIEDAWWLGGIFFRLPAGITLPARGRLRLVASTPADACMSGRIPAGVAAMGPFPLPLSDSRMHLTLHQTPAHPQRCGDQRHGGHGRLSRGRRLAPANPAWRGDRAHPTQ